MAKSLGQIHTINKKISLPFGGIPGVDLAIADIDIPGELTSQLQRMVRQGNMFKVVGIDMTLTLEGSSARNHMVSGYLRYYAPTQGRCAAYRAAFKAMADAMKLQGISMRDNPMYDFRAPINNGFEAQFANQATLNGTDGLCLYNTADDAASIFGVHNSGVRPQYTGTAGDLYTEGFSTKLADANTDFVLQDAVPFTGNHNVASLSYETIPFTLNVSADGDESSTPTFQWRPDPALYLAILCGQFQVVIVDNVSSSIDPAPADLNFAVMVSGWKSVMGNPNKKKSSKKRSRK